MTHIILIEVIIKIGTDQIVVTGKISIDKIEVDPVMNKIIGEENFKGNARLHQDFGRQNSRGN